MARIICYKDLSNSQTYLAYYTRGSLEDAQKEAEEINTRKPDKLFNGQPAHCDSRIYFADEQEEMY